MTDQTAQEQQPIFVLWTRSFWLSLVGVGVLLAQDTAAVYAFADIIALFFNVKADAIAAQFMKYAPAFLFIAALQQRAGASRPYTLDPGATE